MKKIISIYVILLSIIYAQGLDRNIDQFKTNSFIRPVAKDSIEVLSFVEVSSNALQFLKKDNLFEAKYEVNIAILNDNNEKKSSQLFSDTIIVKKFGDTTSKIKKKIITTAFVLPFDNYTVTSSLKDLDVKLSGKKEQEINLKYLSKSTSLKIYEPIFLKEGKGSWGFGLNKFPTVANRVISDNNIISLNQYIVLNPGPYNITMSVISQKTVQWEDSIDAVSEGDVVSHLANIPIKDIDKRDLTIKVVVTQNDSVSSKSFSFKIKNTMLFDGIDNIDTALAQMSYILTSKEKKELKNLKQSEKEKFFRTVWAKRDPIVKTKVNELMEEYYSRVAFTEENFSRGTSGGWKSDMGMVYILFGKPDDMTRSMNMQGSYNYEKWYYFQIGEEFTFIDDYGFGDYRLKTPLLY
jgi:GWxTD domain-containing protein|tara:strand:+ start:3102 stop:4325 length:1224 start_codon:yes stop_codon:yes gene_type:complete